MLRTSIIDQPGSNESLFARFRFCKAAELTATPGLYCVELEHLAGPDTEYWFVDGPTEHDSNGAIRWSLSKDQLLLHWHGSGDDIQKSARSAYADLLAMMQQLGFPHITKGWNHIPLINEGDADLERYRQFCVGRAEALDRADPLADRSPPAGTAVGSSSDSAFQVFVLAGKRPPVPLENPRQVSAYKYPRQYGPRSPSFSRASYQSGNNLFVSGTAAIAGHESIPSATLSKQVDETMVNWLALLDASQDSLGTGFDLSDGDSFRLYLRHRADLSPTLAQLQQNGLDLDKVIALRADICRSELLVELDGVLRKR